MNDNLDGVFQAGVAGSDLLQELDTAVGKLTAGIATAADLVNWQGVLDTAVGKLNSISYRVSTAYGEVDDVRATSRALKLQEQNALYDIQALDKEAAIMELQLRQTTLEATQRAYAKISNLTLFNFL